jgi:hypothetical protein
MHLKVFMKLKKPLKTLSSGQKNPKKPQKTQKNPKNPKKPKKTQKNPLGWVFFKKPGFFPTLLIRAAGSGSAYKLRIRIQEGKNDPKK